MQKSWILYYYITNDLKKLPSYYKFCYFMLMFSIKCFKQLLSINDDAQVKHILLW